MIDFDKFHVRSVFSSNSLDNQLHQLLCTEPHISGLAAIVGEWRDGHPSLTKTNQAAFEHWMKVHSGKSSYYIGAVEDDIKRYIDQITLTRQIAFTFSEELQSFLVRAVSTYQAWMQSRPTHWRDLAFAEACKREFLRQIQERENQREEKEGQ